MLPQMDASTTALDFRIPKGSGTNAAAFSMKISSYVCPSANINGASIGYCTYRGSPGSKPLSASGSGPPFYSNDGIFYMNSEISDRYIKDGTTMTILFGESQFGFWGDSLSCCARVPWTGPLPGQSTPEFQSRAPIDWIGPNPPPTPQVTVSGPLTDLTQTGQGGASGIFLVLGFGSAHTEVVNFAMCDGSARPISKSISPTILSALATRDTGERISDDF